jgi:hypothetical protein
MTSNNKQRDLSAAVILPCPDRLIICWTFDGAADKECAQLKQTSGFDASGLLQKPE